MSVHSKAQNAEPAIISRRTPDPGKRCKNPNCKSRFFRKENEDLSAYKERVTCSTDCKKQLEGFNKNTKKEQDYRVIDPEMLSCVNCQHILDDSEVGDICGPCTAGQNFRMKTKC